MTVAQARTQLRRLDRTLADMREELHTRLEELNTLARDLEHAATEVTVLRMVVEVGLEKAP